MQKNVSLSKMAAFKLITATKKAEGYHQLDSTTYEMKAEMC